MGIRPPVLAFLFLLLAAPPAQGSDLVEDSSFLRVTIGGKAVRLESLVVKRADATGRLPVALIAHGKPPTQGTMLDERARNYLPQARDLARRGWLAVIAMRRGFGASDGPAPAPLPCARRSFAERFSADADDLQATLNAVAKRADADPSRVIAIGVSAGGAAVAALSARNPKGMLGAVNISGGVRFARRSKEDALVAAFATFGATSRVPSLWIYASNDSYFDPALVERLRTAFLDGGGDVKLVMLEPDSVDGHFIFRRASGRARWLPQMDAFLRFHKLPTWTRDDVSALMRKLGAQETSRPFVENYLADPSEKALARQKSGAYMGRSFGWNTLEQARQSALDACQRRSIPCEVIMENDHWRGPAQ